jgi:hypothetical protein
MGNHVDMGSRATSFDSATFRVDLTNSYQNYNDKGKSPNAMKKRKFHSSDSLHSVDDPWGWFEDCETPAFQKSIAFGIPQQPLQRALSLPPPATEPPLYILESNIETQQLWYSTAGQRPKQPAKEREYFEKLWTENFQASSVNYSNENNTINNPAVLIESKNKKRCCDVIPRSEFGGEIIFKGKAPFSNSVSKSFFDHHVASMTLQLPYYRIFSNSKGEKHAEFLVIISLGSQSSVTFGVWRRHSDFSNLAKKVQERNSNSGNSHIFKNAMLSWQCLLQRKRWYKCLDKDYLSLKCFLLERFMHDLLFESPSPNIISEFLGLE